MPELPEVERLRRTLRPALVGRRVESVRIERRDVVVGPGDPPGGFSRQRHPGAPETPTRLRSTDLLVGRGLRGLSRRGKQLAIIAEGGACLCIHLGMTGRLVVGPPGSPRPRQTHTHLIWRLDDGATLAFRDPRRFGGVWCLASMRDLKARWAALGPDAWDITGEALGVRLTRTRRSLKAALLDQALLAGLGNIYADEALFHARLSPGRPASELDAGETDRLAQAIRLTLRRALRLGGSSLRDYVDATGRKGRAQLRHAVYGRAGKPCPSCGGTLEGEILAQRATVWCPACQH